MAEIPRKPSFPSHSNKDSYTNSRKEGANKNIAIGVR